jgi:hypothetical protein
LAVFFFATFFLAAFFLGAFFFATFFFAAFFFAGFLAAYFAAISAISLPAGRVNMRNGMIGRGKQTGFISHAK